MGEIAVKEDRVYTAHSAWKKATPAMMKAAMQARDYIERAMHVYTAHHMDRNMMQDSVRIIVEAALNAEEG